MAYCKNFTHFVLIFETDYMSDMSEIKNYYSRKLSAQIFKWTFFDRLVDRPAASAACSSNGLAMRENMRHAQLHAKGGLANALTQKIASTQNSTHAKSGLAKCVKTCVCVKFLREIEFKKF